MFEFTKNAISFYFILKTIDDFCKLSFEMVKIYIMIGLK